MTEDIPIQLRILTPNKEYWQFKSDRKWKWRFNREKYRQRPKKAIE